MPRRPFIVVIGSINTDLVLPTPRLPRPGETLAGGDVRVVPGGKGANQAVAAARLGADVAMVGRVGRDDFGQTLRAGLAADGIDVRHVRRTAGASGSAVILVQPGGENSIVLSAGANAKVTPADVDAAAPLIRRADAVLLQLEIPHATVRHAVRLCRKLQTLVVLDPAPAPPGKAPAWMKNVDLLCPNEEEAVAVLGHATKPRTTDATALALVAAGATDVVMTLGGRGALHADASRVLTHVPAFKVDPVDTTAAGDTFTAALAVARAGGAGWAEAMRFASAAGALACTKLGAQPSIPHRGDVIRLMRV